MSVATAIIKLIKRKKKMNDYNPDQEPNTIQHPVLIELNTKVANLESLLQAQKDTSARYAEKYRNTQTNTEILLKELLDDEEIEYDVAKRIADLFDYISLTKQVEVQYTISATATIEVPYGADADDVASSTYVERVEFYTDYEDAEVLESDFDTEDWNVR